MFNKFFLISSLFLQIKNIDNKSIGSTTRHISINTLQIVENWDELGLFKIEFAQFFLEVDGVKGINEENIFNYIKYIIIHKIS